LKYRAEIDGLRALAIVPVILFHAGFELFNGGFVGVDVFFVISGYLITTILIEDIENNRFNIVNFYERRARRILPALFFVMLVCIPFAWMWMPLNQMKDFSQSLVAVSLFASNILFWEESDYFDAAADEKPLLHTWSLAVEEQYYVLFPIFLFLAWRFGKNRVFWMIVVMATISLLLSEWGWRNKATANFYLAPTRAWEILAGSMAAFIEQKKGMQKNDTFSLIGLAAIIFSILVYDESTPFPSVYALVPVVGVLLLVLFADRGTLAARLLSTKAFVGIGLISYSAYLWHQPLFAYARIRLLDKPSEVLMSTLSIFSMLLAYVSWKYIEKPFRQKNGFLTTRKPILVFSLSGFLLFTASGFFGHFQEGFKNRFTNLLEGDVGHLIYHQYIDERYFDCEPSEVAVAALTWKGFLRCKQSDEGELDWLLLGDSHAEHLFLGLAEASPDTNIAFYIFNAPPYRDEVSFEQIFNVISRLQNPKKIFLTMHFVSKVDSSSALMDGFGNTISFLKELGHDVILIGDVPRYKITPDNCKFGESIERVTRYCSMPQSQFQLQRDVYESTMRHLASEFDVRFITIHEPLCSSVDCSMVSGNTILYRDNNHLNIPGSILVGRYLVEQL
jgi:peptidoglycan/LPS O-acetylase OafA/YrhL